MCAAIAALRTRAENAERALLQAARVLAEAEECAFLAGLGAAADHIDKASADPIHKHPGVMGWCASMVRHYTNLAAWRDRASPPLVEYRTAREPKGTR